MTFWPWDDKNTPEERIRLSKTTVPLIDQFLAVLMRVKFGPSVKDISDRFSIGCSTFS